VKTRTALNAVVLLAVLTLASSAFAEEQHALNETALYYFFSTVAQTLAASFGILAVFLVFRLPGIEASFDVAREEFRSFTTEMDAEELLRSAQTGGWAFVATRLREIRVEPDEGVRRRLGRFCDAAHRAWNTKQALLGALRISLVPTIVAIAVSLSALPVVPHLADHTRWAIGIVLAVLLLSFFGLTYYGLTIIGLVDPARWREVTRRQGSRR
jgi:hypothetical protein